MQIKPVHHEMKCDEAIKCVFNLNKLDLRVFKKLKQIGPTRAIEIAKHLNKERSTIYRSLQKLSKCGMCKKRTKTLNQGGYYHEYECDSIENIQRQAQQCLDSWYETVKETLKSLNDI